LRLRRAPDRKRGPEPPRPSRHRVRGRARESLSNPDASHRRSRTRTSEEAGKRPCRTPEKRPPHRRISDASREFWNIWRHLAAPGATGERRGGSSRAGRQRGQQQAPEWGVSRVLYPLRGAVISLGRPLPDASNGLPGSVASRASSSSLLGLSPDGVFRAGMVTHPAGGLLPHRFTLTRPRGDKRSAFCGTFPGLTAGGRYPPSCPVEPGLSSFACRRTRPHPPLRCRHTL